MKRNPLFTVDVLSVTQPVGTFYITSMSSRELGQIAFRDMRRLETSSTEIEQYLGIQRKLSDHRLVEIQQFVRTDDASFPTNIIIAVDDERAVSLSDDKRKLTFFEVAEDDDGPEVLKGEIARIIDGQHRLAGLERADVDFQLSVAVFTALDIADQAYIFATVNLAQTKVNRSIVYDLASYTRSRSPEKTCHLVAVALNRAVESPFHALIKRLGSATPGVIGETLTQATVVQSLLKYISRNALEDRDVLRRGFIIKRATANEFQATPFRNLFLTEQDEVIARIMRDYFESVRRRWTQAWSSNEQGVIIRRTNGFRAFMNVLGRAYLALGGNDNKQPSVEDYLRIWARSTLTDKDFVADRFHPGSSGERALTHELESAIAVYRTNPKLSIQT